jgi:hypothetical protein
LMAECKAGRGTVRGQPVDGVPYAAASPPE